MTNDEMEAIRKECADLVATEGGRKRAEARFNGGEGGQRSGGISAKRQIG